MTSAVGVMLIVAGHARRVVAEGGSQAIADALGPTSNATAADRDGGAASADDLPPSDVLMLDVAPSIAADILGDRLPARVARSYRRFRTALARSRSTSRSRTVPDGSRGPTPARSTSGGSHDEVVANEEAVSRGHARATVRARRPAVSR